MEGFLLIDKPAGMTSYDVIRKIKTMLPKKTKIGHSGTLDPFATGLLIIAIGRKFTKQLNQLIEYDKTYHAEVTFGIETDSFDIDGSIVSKHPTPLKLTKNQVEETLKNYRGEINQTPPQFSAKKINGVPAYKHARAGNVVDLKAASVTIYELIINGLENNQLNISVHCSKGTYIRSLAHDLGKDLGVGGHLSKLNRLAIGSVSLKSSIKLDQLNEQTLTEALKGSLPQ
tara:strand:+ start:4459 stop:5145 length:687 start_codon:yes stop_codon:yes gene_type:complete